jgi:DNA-binding GntR family transcriptional regulator
MTDQPDPKPLNNAPDSIGEFRKNQKAQSNLHLIGATVHPRLRNAILTAELRPNSRLVEGELAEWLGVSRTPIREALLQLEQEGLVERNRGWIVREQKASEIRERLESRIAVEGYAARLAATRRTETDIQELRKLEDAMEEPGLARIEFNRLNDEFHQVFTAAAKNPTLLNLHSQTKINYWNLNVPVIFTPEADRKVHENHRRLIEALVARDGNQAELIMRGHIQMTLEIVLAALGMADQSVSL